MDIYRILVAVGLALAALSPAAKAEEKKASEVLTVQDFLRQAREGHQGYRASVEASQGSRLTAREADLFFSPALIAEARSGSDSRETQNPTFQGSKSRNNALSLGVRQQFSFGLQAQLTYNYGFFEVTGANPAFLPLSSWSEGRLALELTQPLWRNGFGREVRAQLEMAEANALAASFNNSFAGKMLMAEAESAYWRLVLARESVRVSRDTLERQGKLKEWSAGRVKLQLADRSDLLQSDVAVDARRLELRAAEDEERAAARAFNSARGRDSDDVPEKLQALDGAEMDKIAAPARSQFREDVLAAEQQSRLGEASARAGREKNLPQVDLFGTVATTGRDATVGGATAESFTATRPVLGIGVRATVPLNFGATSDAREGYAHNKASAVYAFERKRFEQERDWNNLVRRLEESKTRLKLARALEGSQRDKLVYERDRQRRGRSTTFQVLQFEQDYASAQLNHIRVQAEVLSILIQMKTFAPTTETAVSGGQS